MATEYISREAAIEAIRSECVGCVGQEIGERFCCKCAIRQREVALYSVPAADVRPVVHRSWIVDDPGDYQLIECDQCHAQMWNHQKELPNYCYCCGADMRKVVEIDQVEEGTE